MSPYIEVALKKLTPTFNILKKRISLVVLLFVAVLVLALVRYYVMLASPQNSATLEVYAVLMCSNPGAESGRVIYQQT